MAATTLLKQTAFQAAENLNVILSDPGGALIENPSLPAFARILTPNRPATSFLRDDAQKPGQKSARNPLDTGQLGSPDRCVRNRG